MIRGTGTLPSSSRYVSRYAQISLNSPLTAAAAKTAARDGEYNGGREDPGGDLFWRGSIPKMMET